MMGNNDGIDMVRVSSSNVDSIGYDDATQTLRIDFLNGTAYIYKGVPRVEFDGLQSAPSIGSYLHRNIKNMYPYERIQ